MTDGELTQESEFVSVNKRCVSVIYSIPRPNVVYMDRVGVALELGGKFR